MKRADLFTAILISTLIVVSSGSRVFASTSSGTILGGTTLTKICKNIDCSSYSNVNWKPTLNANTTGARPVVVTDSGVSGYVWGDEVSWINLQPTGAGISVNPNTGALSGYAWSSVGSWINFAPTSVPGNPSVGVSINSQGQFAGWAFVAGIYSGWMEFDCSSASTCITTDWRPIPDRGSASPSLSPSQGSSSGSSGGFSGGSTPERQAADLKLIWAYNALQSPPSSARYPMAMNVQSDNQLQSALEQSEESKANILSETKPISSAPLPTGAEHPNSVISKPATAHSPVVIAAVVVAAILVLLIIIGMLFP